MGSFGWQLALFYVLQLLSQTVHSRVLPHSFTANKTIHQHGPRQSKFIIAPRLSQSSKPDKYDAFDLTLTPLKAYIERIIEVNRTLHVVAEINPEALVIAAELDVERAAGHIRGPLHGIPILLKNNIATDDQLNTTAGSYVLLGTKVPRDSTVVRKLREAGAVILGKTNLSEWANFRSNNSSNGWSARSGQVYSPFYSHQDPQGSSSGSAVAAILGLAAGTLGTETDGSIISPASWNSAVGLKPTVGLTSRHLVIPISEHQDSVGPITASVKDAAMVLQSIAGVDISDNYTSAIPNNGTIPDYISACRLTALKGARIGIPRHAIALRADNTFVPQLQAFEKAIAILKDAGAIIVDNVDFTAVEEFLRSPMGADILNADFPVNLASYLSQLVINPNNISSLEDVRHFTQSFPLEDFPDRNTARWDAIFNNQRWNNTDPRFWIAYQKNLYFGNEGGLLGAIARHRLDAVIMPANRSPTFVSGTGAPAITVPLGFHPPNSTIIRDSRGLVVAGPNIPFGMSFMGAKWTEAKLIGFAYAFEQRTKVREQARPYILPYTELGKVVATGK